LESYDLKLTVEIFTCLHNTLHWLKIGRSKQVQKTFKSSTVMSRLLKLCMKANYSPKALYKLLNLCLVLELSESYTLVEEKANFRCYHRL